MIGSYVHISPSEGRVRYICQRCRISQICLTFPEAQRTQKAHEATHTASPTPRNAHPR